MLNPFHPEPSLGSFLWSVSQMNLGNPEDAQRCCCHVGLWGKCGGQWKTMVFSFPVGFEGLSLFLCVC